MAKNRDYRAEYERRLASAIVRGLSRSQARGHARANERPIRAPPTRQPDSRLEAALKLLRKTNNQSAAAKEAGVSIERFRRFLREGELAKREGGRWIFDDRRPREVSIITTNGPRVVTLIGFDAASLVGSHNAAVGKFLQTNDITVLAPFRGVSVRDTSKRTHFLETNPNILHRSASIGGEIFESIYRLKS